MNVSHILYERSQGITVWLRLIIKAIRSLMKISMRLKRDSSNYIIVSEAPTLTEFGNTKKNRMHGNEKQITIKILLM